LLLLLLLLLLVLLQCWQFSHFLAGAVSQFS